MGKFNIKKSTVILISVIAVLLIIVFSVISSYNGLVSKQETVEESWHQISVVLQRRADLIPNLVETVKGYKDYEQETLTAVTEARNAFVNSGGDVNSQVEASNELNSALDIWVNAVTEAYPELKANEQFRALTDELSGSENRISYARETYNKQVKNYNSSIRSFPRNILANIFGFDSYTYFEADEGADKAPSVSFQ